MLTGGGGGGTGGGSGVGGGDSGGVGGGSGDDGRGAAGGGGRGRASARPQRRAQDRCEAERLHPPGTQACNRMCPGCNHLHVHVWWPGGKRRGPLARQSYPRRRLSRRLRARCRWRWQRRCTATLCRWTAYSGPGYWLLLSHNSRLTSTMDIYYDLDCSLLTASYLPPRSAGGPAARHLHRPGHRLQRIYTGQRVSW